MTISANAPLELGRCTMQAGAGHADAARRSHQEGKLATNSKTSSPATSNGSADATTWH